MLTSTAGTLACAGVCAVAGGVAGFFLPFAAQKMLDYKYDQITNYWENSLKEYVAFKKENDRCPLSGASGHEGALGIWLDDQFNQASCGNLTQEQAKKLREAGIKV